jgi:hypothetical protein
MSVDPCFGEIYYKLFRFLGTFESILQAADRMRVSLVIAFPRDFSSRTPQFTALL